MTGSPRLTIVGGPNGAGKSTLTRTAGLRGHLIDPDAIAKAINPAGVIILDIPIART